MGGGGGGGVLLKMGSAEGAKTQVRCENTGKYTGHKIKKISTHYCCNKCKTFLPVIIVVNQTEHSC